MDVMLAFLLEFLRATFDVLYESSIYVLFGFLIAGILHVYLPTDRVVPHLRSRGIRSIAAAAALGAPLPLCSCGVVPSAVELRRGGASREAVMSFLVSTPETSADSIALSWGLLGPVFAIVRPVVALISAIVAGLMHLVWGGRRGAAEDAGHDSGPACHVDHGGVHAHGRLLHGIRYGMVTLFDDLAFWFVLGILLTGLITAVVPDGFLARTMHSEFLSMIVAAAIGIPLYMCASGSTPVAAALLAKGLSPGAALVFLLTGPGTNAATISVVGRTFGRRFLAIYLASIGVMALLAGLLFNRLYAWDPSRLPVLVPQDGRHGLEAWVKGGGLAVLILLLIVSLRRTGLRPGLRELRANARFLFPVPREAAGRRGEWKL